MNQQALSSLIWSVADLLRGDFKQSEYGRVILPFTVLRRLDCVLAPTKAEVLKEHADKQAGKAVLETFPEACVRGGALQTRLRAWTTPPATAKAPAPRWCSVCRSTWVSENDQRPLRKTRSSAAAASTSAKQVS